MRLVLPASLGVLLAACQTAPIQPPAPDRPPMRAAAEPSDWQALLPRQLDAARAAAARYRDVEVARAEGWKPFGGGTEEPLMGTHYWSETAPDYVAGDAIDPARPNNLMYAEVDGETVLTGLAFVVRIAPGDALPAGFAGPEDRWHAHDFVDAINAATEERPLLRGLAARWLDDTYFAKGDANARLAMVHVWTEHANPDGVFADVDRTLPYRKLGLTPRYWRGASVEAARGLHLATPDGCRETFGAQAWIGNVSGAQEREVAAACIDAARVLKTALGAEPDVLNRAAERAWTDYRAAYERVLSPEQRARIAAMTEHGDHGGGHGDGHHDGTDHGDTHHGGH